MNQWNVTSDILVYENILLCISYDGTNFCGYQRQRHDRTVQQTLEDALEKLCSEKIVSYVAGRTDSGVHAERQYVHFLRPIGGVEEGTSGGVRRGGKYIGIPAEKISNVLNTMLPADIRVHCSRTVDENFHARYSAEKRAYYYQLYEGRVVPAPMRAYCLGVREGLDWDMIHADLQAFVGTHDFSAVSSRNEQVLHHIRNVTHAEVRHEGMMKKIYIEANAFLWKMVRTIIGTVLERAEYRHSHAHQKEKINAMMSISDILESKDRSKAGATVVPRGLFLYDVKYKDEYEIKTRLTE